MEDIRYLAIKIDVLQAQTGQNLFLLSMMIFLAITVLAVKSLVMMTGFCGILISFFGFVKMAWKTTKLRKELDEKTEKNNWFLAD